jgi:hypothetical protein
VARVMPAARRASCGLFASDGRPDPRRGCRRPALHQDV